MRIKYLLSKVKMGGFEKTVHLGNYYFHYNIPNDKINFVEEKNKRFIVIGNFVDASDASKQRNEIIDDIIKSNHIEDLIENTRYLAGRYLIFMEINDMLQYILPDPVGTIPVNYLLAEDELMISSHQKDIADLKDLEYSQDAVAIKAGAEEQQPLPNDITMYNEIRAVIPNHYLDVVSRESIRYFPIQKVRRVSMDQAVTETINKVKNIINAFYAKEKLAIPITSGIDSRTVLALFKEHIKDIPLYTYFSDHFDEESGDIKIPTRISEAFDLDYRVLDKKQLSEEMLEELTSELAGLQNENILRNGLTFKKSELSGYRPVPGDIISIAKSPFGKNLPEKLATLNYFLTKSHNYSAEIKKHIEEWMQETKPYTEEYGYSLYDIYNWEFRLGRWLPNNIQNYDYFMQPVYLFNCRYLLELWLSVSREDRTKRSLHKEIIQKEWPELLDFPLNPDDKFIDKVFDNSYMFYMGSFIKYHLKRFL